MNQLLGAFEGHGDADRILRWTSLGDTISDNRCTPAAAQLTERIGSDLVEFFADQREALLAGNDVNIEAIFGILESQLRRSGVNCPLSGPANEELHLLASKLKEEFSTKLPGILLAIDGEDEIVEYVERLMKILNSVELRCILPSIEAILSLVGYNRKSETDNDNNIASAIAMPVAGVLVKEDIAATSPEGKGNENIFGNFENVGDVNRRRANATDGVSDVRSEVKEENLITARTAKSSEVNLEKERENVSFEMGKGVAELGVGIEMEKIEEREINGKADLKLKRIFRYEEQVPIFAKPEVVESRKFNSF